MNRKELYAQWQDAYQRAEQAHEKYQQALKQDLEENKEKITHLIAYVVDMEYEYDHDVPRIFDSFEELVQAYWGIPLETAIANNKDIGTWHNPTCKASSAYLKVVLRSNTKVTLAEEQLLDLVGA